MTPWSAPAASPAPRQWTPGPESFGDRRDGLIVTDRLRSVLHPRRRGWQLVTSTDPGDRPVGSSLPPYRLLD
jgi:hypothetical protein